MYGWRRGVAAKPAGSGRAPEVITFSLHSPMAREHEASSFVVRYGKGVSAGEARTGKSVSRRCSIQGNNGAHTHLF
jgi:hypothetical protein